MLRLFIVFVIICLVLFLIKQIRAFLARDKKLQELNETKLEGDLIDIDKEIAEEQARQNNVSSEIEAIKSQEQNKKKESIND